MLVAAAVLYVELDYSWLLFVALILAPDASFAGYLAGPSVGAAAYNLVHTTVLPLALTVLGVLAESDEAVAVALIWLAHIGVDRALGYGLKYPTAFKDTYFQRL